MVPVELRSLLNINGVSIFVVPFLGEFSSEEDELLLSPPPFCSLLPLPILDNNKLKVEASDWAVLLLVASSSFSGPFTAPSDSKKDPTSQCFTTLSSISNVSYSHLYARHLNDYQGLFHRVSLQLMRSTRPNISEDRSLELKRLTSSVAHLSLVDSTVTQASTSDRVKSFQTDEDPSLVELLFQYGRYLLISSSRPGTQVANLQGIWNKDLEPVWEYVYILFYFKWICF